jgi:putative PIN family toxin of toxin-antitoxin system
MNTTGFKIVLDTNIFIAIIGKQSPFRWIFDKIIEGSLVLCISNEILLEYREILERKTNEAVANNIVNFLMIHPYVSKIEIFYRFKLISTDEDDNKFVDCAIASNAQFLVSNDRHFDLLKHLDFPQVNIVTLTEFEKLLLDSTTP